MAVAWPLTPLDRKRAWQRGDCFFQQGAEIIIILKKISFILFIGVFLSVRQWNKCLPYYWHPRKNVASFFPTVRCLTSFGTTFPVMRKVLLFTSCGRIVTFPALGERHFVPRAAQLFSEKTNNCEQIMKHEESWYTKLNYWWSNKTSFLIRVSTVTIQWSALVWSQQWTDVPSGSVNPTTISTMSLSIRPHTSKPVSRSQSFTAVNTSDRTAR